MLCRFSSISTAISHPIFLHFFAKKHQEHLSLITILNVIQIPELVGVSTEAKMIRNEAITLVSVMKAVLQKD